MDAKKAAALVARIDAFEEACTEACYTDTSEAWELLEDVRKELQLAAQDAVPRG